MSDDALAPGGQQAPVAYLKNNMSNPVPVQTASSPPRPPTPTQMEPPSAVAPSPGHKGLGPGAVAGLSIGLALGILLLAVLAFAGCRSKHRHRRSPTTDGETSLGKPSVEDPREAEKLPTVLASKTPHFGPCSKLARPNWTADRNASHSGPSATLKPPPAPSRPKRRPASILVGSEVLNPFEQSFLCSPQPPRARTSAGPIQVSQPSRAYRPPTPYYPSLKTNRPGHGIDPFTLSKPEGSELHIDHTHEVMEA